MQHLSTADIDTFIRPFVHCAFLLAMATPVLKTFTTDVGQMQRRRHRMTARGRQLCIVLLYERNCRAWIQKLRCHYDKQRMSDNVECWRFQPFFCRGAVLRFYCVGVDTDLRRYSHDSRLTDDVIYCVQLAVICSVWAATARNVT